MSNEEDLFNALLDKPEYYEFDGKKIPIHSLGISMMELLVSSSFEIPEKVRKKILNDEKLTEEETKLVEELQEKDKKNRKGLMPKLLVETLKITFPDKTEEELSRISMKHWDPLIKIVLKLNLTKFRERNEKDFQKPQPEKKP